MQMQMLTIVLFITVKKIGNSLAFMGIVMVNLNVNDTSIKMLLKIFNNAKKYSHYLTF